MPEAAEYSVVEPLRDGRLVEIRALRPDDRDGLVAAVGQASARSLYRRFFAVRRSFTDEEIGFFVDIDFIRHVALVAIVKEDGRSAIAGGGRYIVGRSGQAELAFAVLDHYQQLGIGSALLRHLVAIARQAGLKEFVADVLFDNGPMLSVFERSGLPLSTRREAGTVHVTLWLCR